MPCSGCSALHRVNPNFKKISVKYQKTNNIRVLKVKSKTSFHIRFTQSFPLTKLETLTVFLFLFMHDGCIFLKHVRSRKRYFCQFSFNNTASVKKQIHVYPSRFICRFIYRYIDIHTDSNYYHHHCHLTGIYIFFPSILVSAYY